MAASTNTVTHSKISDKIYMTDITFVAPDTEITPETTGFLSTREILAVIVTNNSSAGFLDATADLSIKDVLSNYDIVSATGNGVDIGGDEAKHYVFPETTNPAYVYEGLLVTITGNTTDDVSVTVSIISKEI